MLDFKAELSDCVVQAIDEKAVESGGINALILDFRIEMSEKG